jgi:hypothetical protein
MAFGRSDITGYSSQASVTKRRGHRRVLLQQQLAVHVAVKAVTSHAGHSPHGYVLSIADTGNTESMAWGPGCGQHHAHRIDNRWMVCTLPFLSPKSQALTNLKLLQHLLQRMQHNRGAHHRSVFNSITVIQETDGLLLLRWVSIARRRCCCF